MHPNADPIAPLEDPQDMFRKRLIWVYIIVFVAQSVALVGETLAGNLTNKIDLVPPIVFLLTCIVGILTAYFRLRLRFMARVFLTLGVYLVFDVVYDRGGLMGYNAYVILIIPALGTLMLGSRDTTLFTTLTAIGLICLIWFDAERPAFVLNDAEALAAHANTVVITVLLIAVCLFVLVRQSEQNDLRLRAALEQVEFVATHDALTGLANRIAVNARLNDLDRNQRAHFFYLIDLDGFKPINDSLGHAAGDAVLGQVASNLRQTVPGDAFLARLGGDEFLAVIAQDKNDAGAQHRWGEALVRACHIQGDLTGGRVVAASIGSAQFPQQGRRCDDVMSKADRALYGVKEAGKSFHAPFVA